MHLKDFRGIRARYATDMKEHPVVYVVKVGVGQTGCTVFKRERKWTAVHGIDTRRGGPVYRRGWSWGKRQCSSYKRHLTPFMFSRVWSQLIWDKCGACEIVYQNLTGKTAADTFALFGTYLGRFPFHNWD